MEIQMNKIIQKKGETEEEYKRNQELITHKLGNLIPKSHYGYNFLWTIRSPFQVPKALLDG